ncbi:MAG: DNA polymerase III subunit delta [Acidobacteria bacterium]|nr:DNA polymerase III subunit delta [Acidobacteriota bacterium]
MRLPASRALQQIRQGIVSPGYVLFGRQIYWRDRIWEALREACSRQGDVRISEFDLRHDSPSALSAAAQARSLLSQQQLLLARNAQGLFTARNNKKEGVLEAYFQNPNPDSVLVLEMMDLDPSSEDWREREKVKSRLEAVGSLCDVILLTIPDFPEAVELVLKEGEKRDRVITREAAQRLVGLFERDMGRIQMEIEKLCVFCGEAKTIEAEALGALVAGQGAALGTQLTEAIGGGDAKLALKALARAKQNDIYPPLILSETVRYLRQLLVVKEAQVRDPRQAGKLLWEHNLGASPDLLPRIIRQARYCSRDELLGTVELAYRTEVALRYSPPDSRILVEQFVIHLLRSLNSARN